VGEHEPKPTGFCKFVRSTNPSAKGARNTSPGHRPGLRDRKINRGLKARSIRSGAGD